MLLKAGFPGIFCPSLRGFSNSIKDLNILVVGDSIAGRVLSKSGTQFNTALETYFTTSTENDVAISGFATYKTIGDSIPPSGIGSLWDDVADDFTSDFTTEESTNSVVADDINCILLISGTNDTHSSLEAGFSKATYKGYLQEFVSALLTRYPNAQKLIICPLHRNDTVVYGNKQYQGIREAQTEVAQETSKCFLGPVFYDADLVDTVHPADAEFENLIAPRIANAVAVALRKSGTTPAIGPQVISAVYDGFTVEATLGHNGGTDIVVPAGGEDFFRFTLDDTNLVTPSDTAKGTATSITLDLDNVGVRVGSTPKLYTAYGQLAGLSQTSPEVPVDNATPALPLRNSVIDVVNEDVISQLTDLEAFVRPATVSKTYGASTFLDTMRDHVGMDWTSAAGRELFYLNTSFDNAGGFFVLDGTTSLRNDSDFTAGSELMIGLVVEFPASFSANSYIACLGNATAGRADATLLANTSGFLVYSDDSVGDDKTITSDCRSERAIILLDYRSDTELAIYYNSTTPVMTFAPDTVFNSRTRLWLAALNNTANSPIGVFYGDIFVKTSAHNPASDPSIADIFEYWNDKYSVGLTL